MRPLVTILVFGALAFAASAAPAQARIAGTISFSDLNFGSYEVTVSLEAFQTAVFENVTSSRTTDLRVKLTAGQITETVPGGGVL